MEARIWIGLLVGLAVTVRSGDGVQSVWTVRVDENQSHMNTIFPNYMYKDSFTTMTILCYAAEPTDLIILWTFRQVHCMEQMYKVNLKEDIDLMDLEVRAQNEQRQSRKKMLTPPPTLSNDTTNTAAPAELRPQRHNRTAAGGGILSRPPVAFQMSAARKYTCHEHNVIQLEDESAHPYRRVTFTDEGVTSKVETVRREKGNGMKIEERVVSAWEDGMYHFELIIKPLLPNQSYQAEVTVEMHGRYGYLPAIDWPLLPYNGIMSFLYLVLSTVWIMTWARSHRFTLRIHVGMGLVAVAGAMSHTLVFVQHAAENSKDGGAALIMWFAQVLSCVQIAFLNFILMVVSTGYGINTPTLPRRTFVLMSLVCGLQFLLGVAWIVVTDSALQLQYKYPVFTKGTLWCKVAIFVVIAAWIMISTIRTLAHLRLRPHAGIKVITFTVFMVSCIIAFLLHMVIFVLSIGWMQACRTNWQLQWVFNSHIGAFLLLIVLMVLWRPVDTAQSYAFAPLGMEGLQESGDDDDDDDEEEVFIKEANKIQLDEL